MRYNKLLNFSGVTGDSGKCCREKMQRSYGEKCKSRLKFGCKKWSRQGRLATVFRLIQ